MEISAEKTKLMSNNTSGINTEILRTRTLQKGETVQGCCQFAYALELLHYAREGDRDKIREAGEGGGSGPSSSRRTECWTSSTDTVDRSNAPPPQRLSTDVSPGD